MSMSDMLEFKQVFFNEATELLADMEDRLLKFDLAAADREQLNAIFRCAHSIKGGAGAFGIDPVMNFTHVAEALLDAFRDGRLMPTRTAIDALLRSVDVIRQMLETEMAGGVIDAAPSLVLMEDLKKIANGAAVEKAPEIEKPRKTVHRIYDITFHPHKDLMLTGNEPVHILRALSALGEVELFADTSAISGIDDLEPKDCLIKWSVFLTTSRDEHDIREVFEFVESNADIRLDLLPGEAIVAAENNVEAESEVASPKTASAPIQVQESKTAAVSSIRVDLDKIDRLVNMVGELVITEAMLHAQMRGVPPEHITGIARGLAELSHHTRELQEAVMAVRMQPVKSVFSRMPRIVRDTASQLGKDIEITLHGESTEVDKTVIEQLGDPLTHMIRNSVDHGIEAPDVRLAAGKSERGSIHLSAYHRSGQIIIDISDDGAGINRERVLSKAIEKGLVPVDAQLAPEEIDQLIFLPGFSTAAQVTSVSGRGVGMDVVRRNIESLGGTVRITNTPGEGSVFSVALPLTLAILDGMIARVGAEHYIIPITHIIETLRPAKGDIRHVQGSSDVINVRGEFLPLIYLQDVFDVPGDACTDARRLVVVVESGNSHIGIVVDELVGQQQVVIKSLEENADPVRGISGATILGDGKVSLILEINELQHLGGADLSRRLAS